MVLAPVNMCLSYPRHKIFPLADEDFFRDDPIESIDAKGEDTQPEIFNW
jgi:hypothetical protein